MILTAFHELILDLQVWMDHVYPGWRLAVQDEPISYSYDVRLFSPDGTLYRMSLAREEIHNISHRDCRALQSILTNWIGDVASVHSAKQKQKFNPSTVVLAPYPKCHPLSEYTSELSKEAKEAFPTFSATEEARRLRRVRVEPAVKPEPEPEREPGYRPIVFEDE